MKQLSSEEVIKNSKHAFNMWKDLWINNCALNKHRIQTSLSTLVNFGRHKKAILFSFGPSLMDNIDTFKKEYQGRYDILVGCVDKAFKTLVEAGVKVDFVLLVDATVSAEKWLHGVPYQELCNTLLISNVYGSPGWSKYWEDAGHVANIYWFLGKDNINTQSFFGPLVNYYEVIEAASNVGNTLIVITSKVLGCRNQILFAYDYSFKKGTYYGNGDHNRSRTLGTNREVDINGDLVYASSNMVFSAQWLTAYILQNEFLYGVNVINRTGNGILNIRKWD